MVHVIESDTGPHAVRPPTRVDLGPDATLWDDAAEVAEAVLSCGPPVGFVRRRLPVGGRRANAYARVEPSVGGQWATIVVVVPAEQDHQASRRELRRRFGLTRREAQVALHLAERRSNREIAESLQIADRTARRHTERVLSKLNTTSRMQVAAVVARATAGWDGPT